MFKIGDRVWHDEYGEGEIVTTQDEVNQLTVAFDKEFEVLTGSIIDTDHYFEDDRELEKTKFIKVLICSLSKYRRPHCHSCRKVISTITHKQCNVCDWILCDCGSCRCDYMK